MPAERSGDRPRRRLAAGDAGHLPLGFPPEFGRGGTEEADALLALRCLQGIVPVELRVLAWQKGSAAATREAIRRGAAGSDGDRSFLEQADLPAIREALARCGARLALPGDAEYCPTLLKLADPPIAIFVRGCRLEPAGDRVAIIGARRPSPHGREIARRLAAGLATGGVEVVSGGALGIDAFAHVGALDADGSTVAVLGSGIDVPYPATNRRLFDRILASGSLISEYPPGTPALPHRFPARNRLIAALTRGVVVVEGRAKSGTRITAEHAMDIGVEVFAVPGPVTAALAETPLELLREGATLIRGVDDLLEDLGIEPGPLAHRERMVLGPTERSLLEALEGRLLPERLATVTGLAMPSVLGVLTRLELAGVVRCVGGRFERTLPLEDLVSPGERAAPGDGQARAPRGEEGCSGPPDG